MTKKEKEKNEQRVMCLFLYTGSKFHMLNKLLSSSDNLKTGESQLSVSVEFLKAPSSSI
jgi:hypothetical protein